MKYTEGICEDGAAILCDGQPITISQILGRLNLMDEFKEENERYEAALVKCKNKFEFYEQHHLAKGDTEKAAKNAEMVEMIRNTLIGK
jgi:hypothetical protein